ncbi:twin-arginine translocation signal domain-containing protein [Streptomyces scopuliridis]|uniref:twin-arginine translocation signal domain-containing protein n=1 Tax=Streptomyces scopuliridis TaxID=452529 RepID=UPI0034498082
MNDFSRRKVLKATAAVGAGAVVVSGVEPAEVSAASAVNTGAEGVGLGLRRVRRRS